MARYDHLPICKDAVGLAALREEAVRGFRRCHKCALGTDLRRQAYAVWLWVVVANSERDGRGWPRSLCVKRAISNLAAGAASCLKSAGRRHLRASAQFKVPV